MNSQEIRALQEAYLEVVMNEEKRKYPYSKVHNQNIRLQRNASSETDPEKQEEKYKQADRHREIHTRVRNLPYHQLGNPENRLKPNGKTTSNSTSSQFKQTSSGETTAQRARRDPEFRRQMIRDRMKTMSNEGYDLYDIILSHLLDEGYAETQEQAEVIMVNMSEDWRESICEGYVPLRTSDEHYDDEGFPTTTRSWSKKMTNARLSVGKQKMRSRYDIGDPLGNLTKGVSAAKRLEKMKQIDAEPESKRAKRSQAASERNRQLGSNKRKLQTSLDREHLTRSLKSS